MPLYFVFLFLKNIVYCQWNNSMRNALITSLIQSLCINQKRMFCVCSECVLV